VVEPVATRAVGLDGLDHRTQLDHPLCLKALAIFWMRLE